jgi:hypothetical protein
MKVTRRVALYLFGLSIILLAGEFPLWGAEDYLAKFGVSRLDKTVDAPELTLPDLKGKKRSLSDFQGRFVISFFINTQGKIVAFASGYREWNSQEGRKVIEQLLSETN